MEMDSDMAPCESCGQDIDISDSIRKRRSAVPTWVRCNFCLDVYHSRCAEIPSKCSRIANYEWECLHCKRCFVCHKDTAAGMMFCDGCDRGCHGRCLDSPIDVNVGDETPFLCKDCIEAKHTTRGFRRTKILGVEKRQLVHKRDASVKANKIAKRTRAKRQRHSQSVEADNNDSSSGDDETSHSAQQLPHTCPAKGCEGQGHLNGHSEKHFTLETCPTYNNIAQETAKMYVDTLTVLKSGSGKKPCSKEVRQVMDSLSRLADERMTLKSTKLDKITKPTEVFLAPQIKGVSEFSRMLFEMSKISHAVAKPDLGVPTQGKSKQFIERIQIGKFILHVEEMSATCREEPFQKEAFFCDVCLALFHDHIQFNRHMSSCSQNHPPGMEIYAKNDIAIYEVDGREHKEFCQNLSLLSRFFLSTKAVCYDVIYMMYYVLTQKGADGRLVTVGYFSKDKDLDKNTLACILVLPQFENQGFGKLLIDLSYIIAKTTHKPGTPERPLSRPGVLAFTSYWKCAVSTAILNTWETTDQYSELIESLVSQLGMAKDDIEDTLTRMDLIKTDFKTKKLMLLKESVKELLEENAKKREQLRTAGILIDTSYVKKTWLKILTTRKHLE